MLKTRRVANVLVALGLAVNLPGAALAAAPHGSDGHAGPAMELRLDNGRKWATDEPLRTGMSRIRGALDNALPQIHASRFSAGEFSALADNVQEQVDYVVTNCSLPEDADLQLHIALTRVLDGVNAMRGPSGQELGAAAIVQALNAYGQSFDHPEWKPLGD